MIAIKGRLKALRRTKLYDLIAAAPVIAWFAFCVAQMLPSLAQRLTLVMLFVRTDPSVLPAAGGPATGNPRAVCPRPPSTLSWRDGRNRRDCAAAPVSMDAVVAGTGMGIASSAHEIRGTGAIPKFSGIRRLHGADGPFGAGRVLVNDLARSQP